MTPLIRLSLIFPLVCVASGAWACPEREAAIAAVEAKDFAASAELHDAVDISPDCDDAFRDWLAEQVARQAFRAAMAAPPGSDERADLLQRSIGYFPHWRSFAALADIAAFQGDRAAEAAALEEALNQLAEGPERHRASEDEIKALYERATMAVLLADTVVQPPSTRAGDLGGIFIPNFRGFVVEEVPLPITFAYDSTAFSERGAAYARQLLDHLLSTRPEAIELIGHTDPKGSDAYNLALSARRAEALRDYLYNNGFTGRIDIDGRGENELPAVPDGLGPDSEEYYRLARRVVLHRQ